MKITRVRVSLILVMAVLLILCLSGVFCSFEGSNKEKLIKLGDEYAAQGQWELAIDEYSKAIELDPRYIEAYGARAFAYKGKGEYDKATADYNKAKELGFK